jgi:hypothetical protein
MPVGQKQVSWTDVLGSTLCVFRAQARLAVSVVTLLAAAAAALPASAVGDPLGETVAATEQAADSSVPAEAPALPAAGSSVKELAAPAAETVHVVRERRVHAPAGAVARETARALVHRVAQPVRAVRRHLALRGAVPPAVLDRPATGVTFLPSSPARALDAQRADRRSVARGFALAGVSGGGTVAARPAASLSQATFTTPAAQLFSTATNGETSSAASDDRSSELVGASTASVAYAACAGGLMAALVLFGLVIPGSMCACRAWMPWPRPPGLVSALELPG